VGGGVGSVPLWQRVCGCRKEREQNGELGIEFEARDKKVLGSTGGLGYDFRAKFPRTEVAELESLQLQVRYIQRQILISDHLLNESRE
jgi:hypothetical protein